MLREFEEAKDGLLILKIVSCIDPDVVDWKQLIAPATKKEDILQNIQLALNACYRLNSNTSVATAHKIFEGDRSAITGLLY